MRKAREDLGISLVEAEQATRIRRPLLQAIEEGRFEDLPGYVYGRGLISSYARFLGVDPAPLLEEYARRSSPEPARAPHILDEPITPLSHPLTRWLLALVLVLAVAGGGWYLYRTYLETRGWRLPDLRQLWLTVSPTPEAEVAPGELEQIAAPIPSPTAPPTATATLGATDAGAATPTATLTATATPTATPSPTATPTPAIGVRIEALALADTYLEVRADGELLWIGILRAGERNEWRADELMQLRVGNAGGLQLLVNGRDVGSLGASGQVINVEYRAGELP